VKISNILNLPTNSMAPTSTAGAHLSSFQDLVPRAIEVSRRSTKKGTVPTVAVIFISFSATLAIIILGNVFYSAYQKARKEQKENAEEEARTGAVRKAREEEMTRVWETLEQDQGQGEKEGTPKPG
jgi:hypothetical protein